MRIYRDKRGVIYVAKGRPAPRSFADPATCGTCGRTWDDKHTTSVTPTPSARCPFEGWRGHRGAS
jgi:hypothetical protein